MWEIGPDGAIDKVNWQVWVIVYTLDEDFFFAFLAEDELLFSAKKKPINLKCHLKILFVERNRKWGLDENGTPNGQYNPLIEQCQLTGL